MRSEREIENAENENEDFSFNFDFEIGNDDKNEENDDLVEDGTISVLLKKSKIEYREK